MKLGLGTAIFALALLSVSQGSAAPETRAQCAYKGDPKACAPYGCIPADPNADPDMIQSRAGFCGACQPNRDDECSGGKCRADGTCTQWDAAPAPPTVWPHFHLLVGDVSLGILSGKDVQPIFGVGYVFQGAFVSVAPVKRVDGPYLAENLPWLYWNAGITAAFAGASENVFADAGLTAYDPALPFLLTTVSLGGLYQRAGASIWNVVNTSENEDRAGPDLSLGFLENVFVRFAYLWPLRGSDGTQEAIVSILYMRDLASDLVPNRFHTFLPDAFR